MNNTENLFVESLNAFKKVALKNIEKYSSSKDDKFYKIAIKLAYKDAQFRTIKGHKSDNKEEIINKIADVFEKSIKSKEDNIILIEKVEKILQNDLKGEGKKQSFGKAQKIVNMGFKYLYCLNKSNPDAKFDKRDIPLDKNILDFYYRAKLNNKNDKKITSWSRITKDQYLQIQDNLKQYIKDLGFDMNPIEVEFIIWNYAMSNSIVSTYKSAKKNYYKLKKDNKPSYECYELIAGILK